MLAARDDWTDCFQSLLARSLRAGGHCGRRCWCPRVGQKPLPFHFTRKERKLFINCICKALNLLFFVTNFSVTLKSLKMDQSTSCTLQCFFPLLLYFCLFSLDSVASAALLNSKPPNPVNPLGISTFKELFITCTCGCRKMACCG